MTTLKTTAEAKWCPVKLIKKTVTRDFSGKWFDRGVVFPVIYNTYETQGKSTASCSVNREDDGSPHPKTLCSTTDCPWWSDYGDFGNGDSGFCSRFDDNMNTSTNEDDSYMLAKGCPLGFKMVTDEQAWTGTISGATILPHCPLMRKSSFLRSGS